MARRKSLISGGGVWGGNSFNGTVVSALTALGTTQATALQLTEDANVLTTVAASTGALIPVMEVSDTVTVANFGANALALYPPVGGKANNGATNAAVSVPAGKGAIVTCVDLLTYIVNISA